MCNSANPLWHYNPSVTWQIEGRSTTVRLPALTAEFRRCLIAEAKTNRTKNATAALYGIGHQNGTTGGGGMSSEKSSTNAASSAAAAAAVAASGGLYTPYSAAVSPSATSGQYSAIQTKSSGVYDTSHIVEPPLSWLLHRCGLGLTAPRLRHGVTSASARGYVVYARLENGVSPPFDDLMW
jgi:hypothetical protein